MILLGIDYNAFGTFVAAAALLVGILSWWIAKLLDTNKKITEHEVKIEDLEEDMKEVKRWYNNDIKN